ncbi:chromate transporter [Candidatus Roizmanbacteria bacterium CG10_big_fil_rev_8_21_14_0_10_45_7]|uniref:Chromate transporter n=1 Tax=Candidatus Roizmanbacteria bacterium CG10_big_fil_rev_8_21_14_0_10_45_7 TaxID=1974854 RepID=A0A2M8KUM9_9BACT|nr:MAG: chromate transporter [Candidatus Roizmanbacteria bacterium CG10_big_fil_rev_8_21_14_0_10_45_7]
MKKLDDTLQEYLVKKAPALPDSVKEVIVSIGPWVMLVLVVMSLPLLLFVFGLGAVVAPFAFLGGITAGTSFGVTMIVSLAALVLEIIALPGLFKRSMGSWRLLYYSVLITAVGNLISFNLGGLIIGTLLSLYILFQVKKLYK